MISSQKKSWVLASANIFQTIFAYSIPKFSSELINMDYISSQEKKIAHDVVYKMPKLQDSCWISKLPHSAQEYYSLLHVAFYLSLILLSYFSSFFFLMAN